jgi:DNA-binding LacI/PurR family transcriptional regulator
MTPERMSKFLWARNIQGVILSPRLPDPGPMEDLEWKHFSTVAIGFSIMNLNVHRVCTNQAHNTRLCLSQLRGRGYQRIGLVMAREVYQRSRGLVLGAYLSEQALLPASDRVEPLFLPSAEITRARLQHWLREQRVEAVALTSQPLEMCAFLDQLGYRIPHDIGVALVARYGQTDHIAGVDERMQALGETAVDAVINLISRNERGLVEFPRYSFVEGCWVERPSICAQPFVDEPIRRAS